MLLATQDTELTQNHSGWKANESLNRGRLGRATLSRGGGAFLGSCDRVWRRGGGYVVDFIYCLRSTRLPLSFTDALARFPLEIYNLHDTVRGCDRTIGFFHQHS